MNGRICRQLRRVARDMIKDKDVFKRYDNYSMENKYKEINIRQKNFKIKDKVIPVITSTLILDECHRKLYKTLKRNHHQKILQGIF